MLKQSLAAVLALGLVLCPNLAFAEGEEAMAISGDSPALLMAAPSAQNWKLSVFDIELKKELTTTQTTTGYDGTQISNTYHDVPTSGKIFAIVKISAARQNLGTDELSAKDLRLHIGNKEFSPKEPISSFLQKHNYSVFSSEVLDKSASGAVAFEIDASYEKTNPEGWYISWDSSKSAPFTRMSQELDQAPSWLEQQKQMEQELLDSYNKQDKKSIDAPYVRLNPYGTAPLSAVALFESQSGGTVEVCVKGKDAKTDVRYRVTSDSGHFEVPIYGLYANYNNTVVLTKDGKSSNIRIKTTALPKNFNTPSVLTKNTSAKAAGGLYLHQGSYLLMFDENGETRWYLDSAYTQNREATVFSFDEDKTGFWGSVNRLTNDVYFAGAELFHMDFVGKILTLHSGDQDSDIHHGGELLANGHILYFSHDTIYELDPATNTSSLYFDFNERFDRTKGAINIQNAETSDIWHQNSVEYVPEDDSILVDVRNQGMVMKLDYKTKEIKWIFTSAAGRNSDGTTWNHLDIDVPCILPADDDSSFEWFHDQHDARCISYNPSTGKMLLSVFDNGTHRYNYGDLPNNDKYSRGVVYEIDENTRTAKLVWQFGKELGAANYSPFHGSVRKDNDGRYLVTFRVGGNDQNSALYVVREDGTVDASYRIATRGQSGGLGSYATMLYQFPDRAGLSLAKDAGSERHEYSSSYWKQYSGEVEESAKAAISLKEASYNEKTLNLLGRLQLPKNVNTTSCRIVLTGSAQTYYFDVINSAYNNFYAVGLPLESLSEGNYSIYVEAKASDGKTYYANLDRYIAIGEDKTLSQGVTKIEPGGQSEIARKLDETARGLSFDQMLVEKDPYGKSPLSAVALFSTDTPAKVHVKVVGKTEAETVEYDVPDEVTTHVVPIVGLYKNAATQAEITADVAGKKLSKTLEITTELGDDVKLPDITITAPDESEADIAKGLTFVAQTGGYFYAVDVSGNIRWYTTVATGVTGTTFTKDMHLLVVSPMEAKTTTNSRVMYDMDLLGRVHKTYFTEGSFHHEVKVLPNGKYLVGLSLANKKTVNDVFAEMDPETGKLTRIFDIEKIFATYGIEPVADSVFGQPIQKKDDGTSYTVNWFHNNAVFYNEADDSYIISGRHKSMVVKIDAKTQKIKWILGDPSGYENTQLKDLYLKPKGNVEWQYAQHAPMVCEDGDILLFDNGTFRSKTQEGKRASSDNFSRVVKYHVDEANMEVSQVMEFGRDLGSEHYCSYIGDADELAPNHYLMDFGGHVTKGADGEPMDIPVGYNTATLYETKDGKVIWQLDSTPKAPNTQAGIYRAERIVLTELPNADNEMSDNFWLGELPDNLDRDISISLSGKSQMKVGETQQLDLSKSSLSQGDRISYSSNQADVAIVDSKGQVTAVAPGSATIVARSENSGKTAAIRIEVTGFAVLDSELTLRMQESYQLKAKSSDSAAISYSSDNPKVATVDKTGNVLAHEVGKATITVTQNGKTHKVTVEVNPIISEGVYTITSAINDRYALDITGASTQNSARLQLWTQHQGQNQQFKISYEGEGKYVISPQTKAGKVLDIEFNSPNKGANVIQYDNFAADNQRFYIEGNKKDGYCFVSVKTGYALDVMYAWAKDGARVISWTMTGAKNQRFMLNSVFKDGIYNIHPKHAKNLVLDVNGASQNQGANVITWSQTGGMNQKFMIQNVGGGLYTITSVHSSLVFDVRGFNAANGAALQQWTSTRGNNQKWRLIFHSDGSVSFESAFSGKVLDVKDAKKERGTDVILWDYSGADWQRFVLDPAGHSYMIQSALDENLVLDITGASMSPEARLILWNKKGSANQQFILSRSAYTVLTSVNSLLSLDVRYGSSQNGAILQQYQYGARPGQQFYFEYAGDGYFYIRNAPSGKVLDVEYAQGKPGANIILWDKTGGANQKFKLIPM